MRISRNCRPCLGSRSRARGQHRLICGGSEFAAEPAPKIPDRQFCIPLLVSDAAGMIALSGVLSASVASAPA